MSSLVLFFLILIGAAFLAVSFWMIYKRSPSNELGILLACASLFGIVYFIVCLVTFGAMNSGSRFDACKNDFAKAFLESNPHINSEELLSITTRLCE